MKNFIKSELIFEVASKIKNQKGFFKTYKKFKYNIEQVDIGILNDEVSKKIEREKGNYICLNFDDLLYFDIKAKEYLCKKLKSAIGLLLKKNNLKVKKLLVIGLGNEKYACDSLGGKVVKKILVTKPYLDKKLFSPQEISEIYALSTGVYGTTGLDSSSVIKSICAHLKPDLVIAIDSMVSGDETRLAKSIQLSDTKLMPGGGVGNSRKEISKDTIGVPVFAIGVPLVVDIANICKQSQNLIVSPKDVENKVNVTSKIIAKAINLSFNNLTETELLELTE